MRVNTGNQTYPTNGAALSPYLRMKLSGAYIVVAGATDDDVGTLAQRCVTTDTVGAVVPPNATGTVKMVAGEATTQYAKVYGYAGGKIGVTVNANYLGIALTAASGDGSYVEVLRCGGMAELRPYDIPATALRVHDAPSTVLPAAAASDDCGVVNNTFLTGAPTVEGMDSKAASLTQYARFQFPVPAEYRAGQTITLRVNAGMKTTVSDTSATLDCEVVRTAAPSVDLCATAAQSINSLTAANKDFTITPTDVVAGDILDVRVTLAVVDGSTGTAVIAKINKISMLLDVAA